MACTGLHTLSFRQNLLSDASQLDKSASKGGKVSLKLLCLWHVAKACCGADDVLLVAAVLQELVLHDNHLTQVRGTC